MIYYTANGGSKVSSITEDALSNACENMQKFGGSFMSNIGKALAHADKENQKKLLEAFSDDIKRYSKM